MQGLMLKLLNVDAAGERALRVVAYFDQLGNNRPDLDSVVRAAALIADCPAGLEIEDRGQTIRYSPDGLPLDAAAPASQIAPVFAPDGREAGSVWIERGGDARDLDEFIVERFALIVNAVLARERPPGEHEIAQGFADPALAQLLVNERVDEAERSRAARLIGLQADARIQCIALEPVDDAQVSSISDRLRSAWGCPVHVAEISRRTLLVIAVTRDPVEWASVEVAGRAAAGRVVDVMQAPESWHAAREGLRFAGMGASWPRKLDTEDLGVIRLLATLDAGAVRSHPDIERIEQLSQSTQGAESVVLLDHFLHADSLRSAAREVNFHHSSLQTRIRRVGEILGMDLRSAAGRERASLALLLWRITHQR